MTDRVNNQILDTNLINSQDIISQEVKKHKTSPLVKSVAAFAFLLPLFPGISMEGVSDKNSPTIVFYDSKEVRTPTFYNYIDTSKIDPSLFGSLPKIGEKKDNMVIAGPNVILHKYVTENASERSVFINPCLSALRKDILTESFTGSTFKDAICTNIKVAYLRYCDLSKNNNKENTEKLAGTIQEMYTSLILATSGLAYGFVMSDWKDQSQIAVGNLNNQRDNEISKLKEEELKIIKEHDETIFEKNKLITELKETGARQYAKHIQTTEQEIIEIKNKTQETQKKTISETKKIQERIEDLIRKQQGEYKKSVEYFNYIFGDFNNKYIPSFLRGGTRADYSVYCFESEVSKDKDIQKKVISDIQEALQTKLSTKYEDFKKLFLFKEIEIPSTKNTEDQDDTTPPSTTLGVQSVIANIVSTKQTVNPNPKIVIEVKKKPQNNQKN